MLQYNIDSIIFWSTYLVIISLIIHIIYSVIMYIIHNMYIYYYMKNIIMKCKKSEFSEIELIIIRDLGEKLELAYQNGSMYLHEVSVMIGAPITKDPKKKFERKYMTQLITSFLNDTKLLRNDFDNIVNKVPMFILEKDMNGKEIISIEKKVYLSWKHIVNLLNIYNDTISSPIIKF